MFDAMCLDYCKKNRLKIFHEVQGNKQEIGYACVFLILIYLYRKLSLLKNISHRNINNKHIIYCW